MGIFLSKLRYSLDKSVVNGDSTTVSMDLPVDAYTCILEFLVNHNNNVVDANDNNVVSMDIHSIVSFRLVSKSTKLAFEKIHGWKRLYHLYQQRVDILTNKIQALGATIADPPSLTCIMRFDAYLTQCWTLKNELSLERNMLQEEVLDNIAKKLVENECRVDGTGASSNHKQQQKKKNSLVLISEWQGDECILKFESIGDDSLLGFSLPAIDSSELPFLLA